MIIAVDFDGTIVEHRFPSIGPLLPEAKEVINALYDQGHEIVIWTCRTGSYKENAKIFLVGNGIKYHAINENAPSVKATSKRTDFLPRPKIYADLYIDDRNLFGFPGWRQVANLFHIK
jgi:hypothetical protein